MRDKWLHKSRKFLPERQVFSSICLLLFALGLVFGLHESKRSQDTGGVVRVMKSIQDVIRQKELELQQALEDAVRVKELELVRLRKTLQEALTIIDHLLENEDEAAESPALVGASAVPKPLVPTVRAHKSGNNGGSEFP